MNVLVVDDLATIRARLVEVLSTLQGVERVDAVASARDASRAVQSSRPDLVVLDPHMLGAGGIEALLAAIPQPTTIVLTNDPTPQGRDTCLRAGAHFVFDKSAEFQRAIDVIAGVAFGSSGRRIVRDGDSQKGVDRQEPQTMEAIGRLAGGVAHDLNNLLTVIIGESQEVIERLPPGDPTHGAAVQIFNAGERAASLARQLLVFSRRQIMTSQVLDLNAVVGHLAGLLRRLLGDRIELAIRVSPEPCAMNGDPGELERLIMNLAVNARDAMPEGGTFTIETADAVVDASDAAEQPNLEPGHYIRLMVSDTGRGMDAHTKARLFEPFFTTKRAGRGTGLGLATVYGIVKQSGGSILVDSEPGRGAVFRLYFPRRPAGEINPARELLARPHPERGTESILFVDNDRGVREFATRALTTRGYVVLAAASPREAQQVCDDYVGGIDLLLTDIMMPDTPGSVLTKALSARHPRMKVIYMSGYSSEAIVDRGVLDPSTTSIAKPFTARGLASKVREALARSGS